MKKNQAISVIGILTIVVVFGFQNCSKVGVQDMEAGINGKLSAGPVDPGLDIDPELLPQDENETPVEIGRNEERHEDKDKDKDCDKDALPEVDKDGVVSKMPTESNLRALCLKDATGGVSGPVIEQLRGITIVESDDLERIEDVRGIMVVRGKTANAKAKLIRNFRGALVVCGMQVEDIEDVRGNVVLVNSEVSHLKNGRGIVSLIDESSVGDVSDFRGVVHEDGKKLAIAK